MENPVAQWLNDEQAEHLAKMAEMYGNIPVELLREQAQARLTEARDARDSGSHVNASMAEGIFATLKAIEAKWDTIDESVQYWLKGVFGYFIADDDELGDFDSHGGFEDELQVLNACLRLAKMDQWALDPADFKDD